MDSLFIVGAGRSGTHFACRSLHGFENIFDMFRGEENPSLLKDITISSLLHKQYPPSAIDHYEKMKEITLRENIFLDQHHPNLFYISEITKTFPSAIFLYTERPTLQVVASMLKHPGVLSWFDVAKKNSGKIPFENQFLGIQERDQLQDMKLYELCTLRVIGHHNRAKLMKKRGFDVRFLNYENLLESQISEFENIFSRAELVQLGEFKSVEKSDKSRSKKYKKVLNEEEVRKINDLENNFKI